MSLLRETHQDHEGHASDISIQLIVRVTLTPKQLEGVYQVCVIAKERGRWRQHTENE